NGVVMAFAVIYLPLITEFGGSRAEVPMVQSAVFLVGGISGPLIGWAFDRLGPWLGGKIFDATGSYVGALRGRGDRACDRRRRDVARAGGSATELTRQRRASASGIDVQLDLVPVGVADRERLRRLAERLETVGFHAAARLGEVVERRAHLERDVIEAGHAL